jgi:hypothetical protein
VGGELRCQSGRQFGPEIGCVRSRATRIVGEASFRLHNWEDAHVSFRSRVGTSAAVGLVLAAAAGTALGAVQVVELSAQRVLPSTVVTMHVAMTAREAGTESGALFMIPSGTFGDSPESLPCEKVGGAVEVGRQIKWTVGTVEYEGMSYAGVTGEATFTVPHVAVGTYWLAESIEARGTGCHIFASIDVVAELPDTALPLVEAATRSGQAVPLGVGLLAVSLLVGRRRTRRAVGRSDSGAATKVTRAGALPPDRDGAGIGPVSRRPCE